MTDDEIILIASYKESYNKVFLSMLELGLFDCDIESVDNGDGTYIYTWMLKDSGPNITHAIPLINS